MACSRKPKKAPKDYYGQIDTQLKKMEAYRIPELPIDWCIDRISWCWKFRHITEEQLDELCSRVQNLYAHSDEYYLYPRSDWRF